MSTQLKPFTAEKPIGDSRFLGGPRVSVGLMRMGISAECKRLAILLGFLTYGKDECSPSLGQLSAQLDTSVTQIREQLKKLETAKIIKRAGERKEGCATTWKVPKHDYAKEHCRRFDTLGEFLRPTKDWVGPTMPWSVFYDPQIPSGAKFLWCRIAWHQNEKGDAYPKISTLAKEVGTNKRNAQAWAAALIEKKRLACDPGKYCTSPRDYAPLAVADIPMRPVRRTRAESAQLRNLEQIWRDGLAASMPETAPNAWTATQKRLIDECCVKWGIDDVTATIRYTAYEWPEVAARTRRKHPSIRAVIDGIEWLRGTCRVASVGE